MRSLSLKACYPFKILLLVFSSGLLGGCLMDVGMTAVGLPLQYITDELEIFDSDMDGGGLVASSADELSNHKVSSTNYVQQHGNGAQYSWMHNRQQGVRRANDGLRKKHQGRKKAAVIEIQPTPIPSISNVSSADYVRQHGNVTQYSWMHNRQQEIWRKNQEIQQRFQERRKLGILEMQPAPIPSVPVGSVQFQHQQEIWRKNQEIQQRFQELRKLGIIEMQPAPIPSVSIGSKQFQRQQEIWRQNQQNWQDFQQQWNSGNLMMAPAPLCTICN